MFVMCDICDAMSELESNATAPWWMRFKAHALSLPFYNYHHHAFQPFCPPESLDHLPFVWTTGEIERGKVGDVFNRSNVYDRIQRNGKFRNINQIYISIYLYTLIIWATIIYLYIFNFKATLMKLPSNFWHFLIYGASSTSLYSYIISFKSWKFLCGKMFSLKFSYSTFQKY